MSHPAAYHDRLQIYGVQLMGLVCACLGAVVIFGWLSQNAALVQIHPSFAPMQFNTALCFMLTGLGILYIAIQSRISCLLGIFVTLLALLTLSQYLFALDLKIDNMFTEPFVTTKTSHPGRMAPNTALCFALSGLILVTQGWRHEQVYTKALVMSILGAFVFILGLTALIGYIAQIESTYGWGSLTRMALHTSIGFVWIGISFIIQSRFFQRQDKYKAGYWASSLLGCLMIVLTLSIYAHMQKTEKSRIEDKIADEALFINQNLSTLLNAQFLALKRMADRWEVRGGTPYPEWQNDAYNYVVDQEGLVSVEWLDSDLNPVWAESDINQMKALNSEDLPSKQALEQSRVSEPFLHMVSPLQEVMNGNYGFRMYLPVNSPSGLLGYLVGVFEYQSMWGTIINPHIKARFMIHVQAHGKEVFTVHQAMGAVVDDFTLIKTIGVSAHKLRLHMTPTKLYVQEQRSALPDMIFLFGMIISVMTTVLIQFALRSFAFASKYNSKKKELKSILDSASESIVGFDVKGNVIFRNLFSKTFFRIDIAGFNYHDIFKQAMPDDKACVLISEIKQALTIGEVSFENQIHYVKNKQRCAIEYSIQPITDNHAVVTGAVIIIRDITAKVEAQDVLAQTLSELQVSNQELEQFAYVASHDLKSPLRGIDNLATWLEEELHNKLSQKQANYLNLIRDRITRMYRLLDDLLAFSKANKHTATSELVTLASLVDETKLLVHNPNGITIEACPSTASIMVGRVPLKQVLDNIIGNAVKYHDKTQGLVKIDACDLGETIKISIKDNGPGIAPQYHEKVFLMFQQLGAKEEVEGSGIGLALVKKIVQRIGGRIELVSDVGEGAEFIIYWPHPKVNQSYAC